MGLLLITAPTTEPLTVAEAKRQVILGSSAGEPAPTAPTVALASPAVAGNVTNGVHRYGLTFVTADGETELGTVSSAVTVSDKTVNGKVELTAIPLGGSAVTSRKLYRTVAAGSTYLLLATISDNTTTTYTDNIADGSLGAQAPSTNTTADPELVRWITAARDRCELATGRALITQTWDLVLDEFPCEPYVELPKPPLQSVTYLKYRDTAGTLQTWSASNYVLTHATATPPVLHPRQPRGLLSLAFNTVWPVTYGQAGDVVIRFVCGYGSASAVPALLKAGMLMDVAALYRDREDALAPGSRVHDIYRSYRSPVTQRVEAA